MKVIFSGIQSSGVLHLGNYLGAIRQWVGLQGDGRCIFCVVDLHSITVPQNPKELRQRILEVAAGYLACGIDPKKSILFQQSKVAGHAELGWILNCVTPFGWLGRMTQFKDKSARYGNDSVTVGLWDYPVLMAADILLYHTDIVPVGEDQKQHVELTRDIAGAFNRQFGQEYFKLPEFSTHRQTTRIMSLADGTKKMSKSDPDQNGCIYLTDSDDEIVRKIKRAKTDSEMDFTRNQEGRPELVNLLNIFSELSGDSVDKLVETYSGRGYGVLKKDLTEVVISSIKPIREKIANLLEGDRQFLTSIMGEGAAEAGAIAEKTMAEVRGIVGID